MSNILTNTESVVFSRIVNVGNSLQERNRQTSCRVVSIFRGYRRGGCCLFYLARYPTTYDSEIGFGTTLSFSTNLCWGAGGKNSQMMKKVLLTVCFFLFCGFVCAQTEHFTFKGLPIDGEEQEFIEKLKLQGYIKVQYVDKAVLSGSFIGRDSFIMVYSTPLTNTVWKVMVLFEHTFNTWSEIKSVYEQLVDLYIQKYGSPTLEKKIFTSPWEEGDGHELLALKSGACVYGAGFVYSKENDTIGTIIIEMTNNCQLRIHYEDKINFDLLEKEQAQEI